MILDKLLLFTGQGTSGQSPTSTGDNTSTFSYDTSPLGLPTGSGGAATTGYNAGSSANAGRDLGLGTGMWLEVLVTAAVTAAGGAATVKFDFVTDSVAGLTNVVDSTGVGVLMASPAFPKATLILGYLWRAQLPASLVYQQYIGVDFVIATNTLTLGTFEAKLVINVQASDLYLSGFAVA